jgi:hypothetical protein
MNLQRQVPWSLGFSILMGVSAWAGNWNIGLQKNYSSSYYSYSVSIKNEQHIYVDNKIVADSVRSAGEAVAFDSATKADLKKTYELDRFGEAIGVNVDHADMGAYVRKYGVDGLQAMIEDRIYALRTNGILLESLATSLSQQNLEGGLVNRPPNQGNLKGETVMPIVDAIRRQPKKNAYELFLDLKKDPSNKHIKKNQVYFEGMEESKENSEALTAFLVYRSKQALEGGNPPVDFKGIDFTNMDKNLPALSSNATAFYTGFSQALKDDEIQKKLEICRSIPAKLEAGSKNLPRKFWGTSDPFVPAAAGALETGPASVAEFSGLVDGFEVHKKNLQDLKLKASGVDQGNDLNKNHVEAVAELAKKEAELNYARKALAESTGSWGRKLGSLSSTVSLNLISHQDPLPKLQETVNLKEKEYSAALKKIEASAEAVRKNEHVLWQTGRAVDHQENTLASVFEHYENHMKKMRNSDSDSYCKFLEKVLKGQALAKERIKREATKVETLNEKKQGHT